MSDIQLPEDLRPSRPLEVATIATDVPGLITMDNALKLSDEILEKVGLAKVDTHMARLVHALGVQYETLGVLRSSRGTSLMNQQAMLNGVIAMNKAMDESTDLEFKSKMAYALGYMGEKLAKVTKALNETEEEHKIVQEGSTGKRRTSFIPGATINAENVQIVNAPQKPA